MAIHPNAACTVPSGRYRVHSLGLSIVPSQWLTSSSPNWPPLWAPVLATTTGTLASSADRATPPAAEAAEDGKCRQVRAGNHSKSAVNTLFEPSDLWRHKTGGAGERLWEEEEALERHMSVDVEGDGMMDFGSRWVMYCLIFACF